MDKRMDRMLYVLCDFRGQEVKSDFSTPAIAARANRMRINTMLRWVPWHIAEGWRSGDPYAKRLPTDMYSVRP